MNAVPAKAGLPQTCVPVREQDTGLAGAALVTTIALVCSDRHHLKP